MQIPPLVLSELEKQVGAENVLTDTASVLLHAYDCSLSRARPDAVVILPTADSVAPVVKLLAKYKIPFVPRAAGTNHAGSCAALRGGVILNLNRLNHILQIDTQQRFAWVEPGVITAQLQKQLEPLGFFYAPDPASERICTLGGNLAQNASGARCMKYGGTIDHILGVKLVLPTGEELTLSRQEIGPDLIGLLAGSEGTLGIITQLQVKILPQESCVQTFLATFSSLEDCVQTVSDLTAQGIIPRCVEAMDQLTTQTIESFAHAGYPTDAAALLLLELDGTPEQVNKDYKRLEQIIQAHHALSFTAARSKEQRAKLWKGRQAAYAAMARLAPNVMVADGTVPRSELPRALAKVRKILTDQQIYAGLLFHAGDGNFHPHLIFDERNKQETKKVTTALKQILQACVDCNGSISGEHGVGVEKRAFMAYQYDGNTLNTFHAIKQATDPDNLSNPLKIIPLDYQEKVTKPLVVNQEIKRLSEQLLTFSKEHTPFVIVGHNSRIKTVSTHTLRSFSLDKILDIDLTNYTVTAQAGVSLEKLHNALSERGVYCSLPVGLGTLGGAFSSGQFPNFYSQVTGIEALLPNGSPVRYGGKLTKNAAGYNLIRLFAGAQGRFGLVTQLTFRIFALPQPVFEPLPFQQARFNKWAERLASSLDPLHLLAPECI